MLKALFVIFVIFAVSECQKCPSGYEDINGRGCFRALNQITSPWDFAQDLCHLYGGNLATIKSCALLGDLTRYLHFNDLESSVGYWIGATDRKREGHWRWLSDNSSVPMGVAFWGTINNDTETWIPQPNGERKENCAMLSPSDQYYFHDEKCSNSGNVLCQTDPINFSDNQEELDRINCEEWIEEEDDNSTCPDHFVRISDSCFHFHFNASDSTWKAIWNDAFQVCQDVYDGSDLAVLSSCDLFKAVVDFIGNNSEYQLPSGTSYWIGGSDQNQEDQFYWIDFTPMSRGVPFWGSVNGVSEPSGGEEQNCVTLFRNDLYYFHDSECNLKAYPLCQTELISL